MMASEGKFTPGPWGLHVGIDYYVIRGPKDQQIVTMTLPDKRDLANARLIAAAPELLDAAKFAFAAMGSEEGRRRAQDVLVAAISKATGSPHGE